MAPGESEQDLVARAISGEESALERLLLRHHDRLEAFVQHKLPPALRGSFDAEDILQTTYAHAFRHIKTFEPQGPEAFYAWLTKIAENRLRDLVRRHRAAKRGGGRSPARAQGAGISRSSIDLLGVINVDEHTPSRSAAGHEAVAAIHVALAGLGDDCREAIRLRYLEGLSVADVAARIGRSPRAVHGLCYRGLRRLRAAMGRASAFLSRT